MSSCWFYFGYRSQVMVQKSEFKKLNLWDVKMCLNITLMMQINVKVININTIIHFYLVLQMSCCCQQLLQILVSATQKQKNMNKMDIRFPSTFSSPHFINSNRRFPIILSSHPNELNMRHCSVPFTNQAPSSWLFWHLLGAKLPPNLLARSLKRPLWGILANGGPLVLTTRAVQRRPCRLRALWQL